MSDPSGFTFGYTPGRCSLFPQYRYARKYQTLSCLIGPPAAGLKSQISLYQVALVMSGTLLVDSSALPVTSEKNEPWNTLPPAFGTAFSRTPLTSASAVKAPTSTVYS